MLLLASLFSALGVLISCWSLVGAVLLAVFLPIFWVSGMGYWWFLALERVGCGGCSYIWVCGGGLSFFSSFFFLGARLWQDKNKRT